MLVSASNGLWYLSCLAEGFAFRRALRDVKGTQVKLLMDTLGRNADTEYGRRYGFATIRSVDEFQERVPLSSYDDYREVIRRIGEGGQRLLTSEPVLVLEPTSGSSSPTKLIPYTATLKGEFQRAVAAWVVDLFGSCPRLLQGQAYWSVTPATRRNHGSGDGPRIGFEEDSEYFGRVQRHLIQSVLAVPPQVRFVEDMKAFRYITLLFLLRSRSLALISVWSPTFLTLLVSYLVDWWPQLVEDIGNGTLTVPASIAPHREENLRCLNRPDQRRAEEIQAAFLTGGSQSAIHARLWPCLRLISCWADAFAGQHVPEMIGLFPQARLQGKGLMATEGVVSFPLVRHAGAVLAIRSHFFEFLPHDDSASGVIRSSSPLLAHQLTLGGRYTVCLTTGGGLYRYELQDLVEVVGHTGMCPLIRFLGRETHVSDRFGEKLNECHVQQALDRLFQRHGVCPTFSMMACEEHGGRHAYTLFIEAQDQPDDVLLRLGLELEEALQQNYHYRYCRDLEQLDLLRVFRVEAAGLETYMEVSQAHGQRAGDIKPLALHRSGGWMRILQGGFIDLT
jgi:hypothetical protein